MSRWRRVTQSWALYWAVIGALLVAALAVGLATAIGRVPPRIGWLIAVALLVDGAAGCTSRYAIGGCRTEHGR